ncbi:MAG TPA: aminotransferase class I/II-fold pyridoxal phosphate-dependent enzyme [Pyrinomonadaceae bacterium]|nr:aminotransferase class I/II-fold pyridoxal phosphate-dependent enzyme [Pyrinomonadaceae bacterium]
MSQSPTELFSRLQAPESTKLLGPSGIALNTGAPKFPVHPKVREAIIKAVEAAKDELSYPATIGLSTLREKIAKDYGYPKEGSVIITYGASQALYNILDTIGDEEVLIPAPFWFAFPHIVAQGRGKLKIIQTSAENNFKLTPQQLRQSITWKSRILLFTNPNNPTGAVYTREELAELVAVLKSHPRLLIVSDEVYNLVIVDEMACPSLSSFPEIHDRVLTVNGLSKNYAMSGLRVGFIAADPSWTDLYLQKENYSTSGVNEFIQHGALAALNVTNEIIPAIVEKLKVRRARAIELLDSVPNTSYITPQAAYFFFWKIEHYIGSQTQNGKLIRTDIDLVDYLLQDANVLVVAGSLCGVSGYFRITYAVAENLFEEAIERIKRSLAKLRRGS